MSQALGPVGFASGSPMFLGGRRSAAAPMPRPPSGSSTRRWPLLREAEDRAADAFQHRDALDRLTELLLERETVDGTDVDGVLGRIPGQRQPIGATGHTSPKEPAKERAAARGR